MNTIEWQTKAARQISKIADKRKREDIMTLFSFLLHGLHVKLILRETLHSGLRVRMVSLFRARKLAYHHDMSRFLRAVRLTLHPARRFIQRFLKNCKVVMVTVFVLEISGSFLKLTKAKIQS